MKTREFIAWTLVVAFVWLAAVGWMRFSEEKMTHKNMQLKINALYQKAAPHMNEAVKQAHNKAIFK